MRRSVLMPVLVCAVAATAWGQSGGTWDPRAFGAKADGLAIDTPAVQAAIDACAAAGGGTVQLQGGVFLSGTIRLRSNVTLCVAAGATLRGSADIGDYPGITPQIAYLYRERFTKSLIYAEREENIALAGGGVIDGQGKLFPAKKGDDGGRPYLIRFSECRNVRVRDLTLRDSARWLSHYLACEYVLIEGVTIHSRIRENRDGMDIDSCDRVRISNCDVYSGDDAIVLKSTAGRPCRRVAVSNCALSSGASALKLGTESQGGFEDIAFGNCVVYDSRDGISIEEVDGGACERITVANIVMRDVEVPIFVRLGNRANPLPGRDKPPVGVMRDIMISNIQASGADRVGCSITGIADHPVENVTLDNVRIRFAGGGSAEEAAKSVPEMETAYPKGTMFGTLPAYGFYCRHVKGLRLHNLDISFKKDDARPAVVADDVAGLDLFGLRGEPGSSTGPRVVLRDVLGALIHGCRHSGAFIRVDGSRSRRIALRGSDLSGARAVIKAADVPDDAISLEER